MTEYPPASAQLTEFLTSPEIRRARKQLIDWEYEVWLDKVGPLHKAVRPTLRLLEDAWAADCGLSREAVRQVGNSDPVALLVASMAWGFGALPYGPARTVKMLQTSNVDKHAAAIAHAAQNSPAQGFGALFTNRRSVINGLGIAMGSKYLYFAAPQTAETSPVVYDQTVYRAMLDLAPTQKARNPGGYMEGTDYEEVCKWMDKTAKEFGDGREADDIEYALFQYPRWKRRHESLQRQGK